MYFTTSRKYFVFASGIKNFKAKYFNSRQAAEAYMHEICQKNGIKVECTEFDKHERTYSDNKNVTFYINRI